MVGIAGDFCPHTDQRTSDEVLTSMLEDLKYTGKEQVDSWKDDSVRLGRVDHAVKNTDKQPIFNEEGDCCIVMVGEVYDYNYHKQHLIDAGYQFEYDDNDAEFCLHLYEEFGTDGFRKLNGSFCLAIYDTSVPELLLVTDRLSSKPLFYYPDEGTTTFASQSHTVVEPKQLPTTLNERAVREFFAFERVYSTRTYYEEVDMVPPSTVLHISDDGLEFEEYWSMDYDIQEKSEEEYASKLATALRNAVDRRTQDDLDYGVLLSGGLDSRAILAAFVDLGLEVTAYSFKGRRYAKADWELGEKLAETAGVTHEMVNPHRDMLSAETLDDAIDISGGMHRVDHTPMLEFIEGVDADAVFHGIELDYTFGGNFLNSEQYSILGKQIPIPRLKSPNTRSVQDYILGECEDMGFYSPHTSKFFRSNENFDELATETLNDTLKNLESYRNFPNAALEYFLLYPPYRNFVHLGASSPGAYALTRPIIYDTDLLDLYLETPPSLRYKARIYRKAIRKLSPAVAAVPNANTGLRADLSPETEWSIFALQGVRDKFLELIDPSRTYPRDMSSYIRNTHKARAEIQRVIGDEEVIEPTLFDRGEVQRAYDKFITGESDDLDGILKILTFGLWNLRHGPEAIGT